MENRNPLWDRIMFLLGQRGMTQADLCANKNVSRSHLNNIRRGTQQPSAKILGKIASRLGVPVWDLTSYQYGVNFEALDTGARRAQLGDTRPARTMISGLSRVDALTSDLRRGDLVLLHGAAGSGKSTLALQWALKTALQRGDGAVVVFGPEDSTTGVVQRLLAWVSGVPIAEVTSRELSHHQMSGLVEAASAIVNVNVLVDEKGVITRTRLARTLGVIAKRTPVSMLVVDALDSMLGPSGVLELLKWLRWRASVTGCLILGVANAPLGSMAATTAEGDRDLTRECVNNSDLLLRLDIRPGLARESVRTRRLIVEDTTGFGRFVDLRLQGDTLEFTE